MTAIELMAALLVLGVMLMLLPPSLDRLGRRWRLRAAAFEVESMVLRARDAAASLGQPIRVRYDVPEGAFWVRVGDEALSRRTLPAGVRFEVVRFNEYLEVTRDVATCSAYPDGTVDRHEVVLAGDSGGRITLTFNRLLGEADYKEELDATP